MTMVNIVVRRDKAMLAVDTGALNLETGASIEGQAISKITTLAHSNVVLSGRGHHAFISSVALMCLIAPDGSLDALDAEMPRYITGASNRMADMCKALLKPGSRAADMSRQEIFLLGYSAASRRMKAVAFLRSGLFGKIDRTEFVGDDADADPDCFYTPYETSWGEPPALPVRANDFLPLARWQAEQVARYPKGPGHVSGNVVVATAMSDRVEIRTVGPVVGNALPDGAVAFASRA